jgi:hypothetical protein
MMFLFGKYVGGEKMQIYIQRVLTIDYLAGVMLKTRIFGTAYGTMPMADLHI